MPEPKKMPGYLASRRCARLAAAAAALAVLGAFIGDALAQRPPYRERPESYNRDYGERSGGRGEPGVFDYYLLSLSWSPTYCAETGERRNDPQCTRTGRPYAFVLHGLWPQHERGWPSNCRSSDRGWVPRPVADRMLDIMPSKRLVFHEYRTHGTCSGLGVDAYFDLARQLYERIKIPKRFVNLTDERMMVSPGEVIAEFVSVNPGLKPDMIVVQCGRTGNRLKEVRICLDKGGEFRTCGRNENQHRLCSADRMYVPPVRLGGERAAPDRPAPDRGGPDPRAPIPRDDMLPGPRDQRRL
jgi:ribonuclease T2